MACQGEIYRSECGGFLCRVGSAAGHFEAWTVDGSIHWRDDNRIQTWKDAAIIRHPMERCVGAYSAETAGQKKGSFTLSLLRCDTTKIVESFQGNTVIEDLDIVFRRKIPKQNWPKWLR
jgi:hypothetical protein